MSKGGSPLMSENGDKLEDDSFRSLENTIIELNNEKKTLYHTITN